MPKIIYPKLASKFAGNTATFFCKECGQRVFEVIKENEGITCSVCGFIPRTKNITLAMPDRRALVNNMFAPDSELSNYLLEVNEIHNLALDDRDHGRLGKHGAASLDIYHDKFCDCLSDVGDYILGSPDSPGGVHTVQGLERQKNRKDRKSHIKCLNFSQFKPNSIDEDISVDDWIGSTASTYTVNHCDWHYNPNFSINDFVIELVPEEQKIVKLLYAGYSKCQIEKILSLSQAELRTIIDHIADHLKNPVKPDGILKRCSRCHTIKPSRDFGKDSRNSCGLQSYCKACDLKRKKFKLLQENQQKCS